MTSDRHPNKKNLNNSDLAGGRGLPLLRCIQERWNPEVVIILGTAACYGRATVGSSHDDVHPDNPTLQHRGLSMQYF